MAASKVSPLEWALMALVGSLLIGGQLTGYVEIGLTEVLGFVTGGVCVWLVVREHIANWPIGLANNIFFAVLFFQSKIYLDAGLQIVYFILAIYGWLYWLYGGEQKQVDTLPVTHVAGWEVAMLAVAMPIATAGLYLLTHTAGGAVPLWDAITTVLSLAAQWLLSRKRLENWWLWITADIIYIPLYISRELYLTAALYAVFLAMCIAGIAHWRRSLLANDAAAPLTQGPRA